MRHATLLAPLMATLLLAACSREASAPAEDAATPTSTEAAVDAAKEAVADKARELAERKAHELMLEQSANADGAKLKVTIGDDGSVRTEGQDKDGEPMLVHAGMKNLDATEFGVLPYPGLQIDDKGATRMQDKGRHTLMASYTSSDAPAKLSAHYRAEVAKLAGVKQVMDMSNDGPDTARLVAVYPTEDQQFMVMVQAAKDGAGSTVLLSRVQPLR